MMPSNVRWGICGINSVRKKTAAHRRGRRNEEAFKQFCEYAKAQLETRFLVSPIGCGIAGYTPIDVAPLFNCCRDVENISLPAAFWDFLQ
jgi:hypothetical protein